MAASDRVRWDARYQQWVGDEGRPETYPAPDPLLFTFTPPLREPGSAVALDLACGLGQNGLWLAAQGYVVDLVDVSRVALTSARNEAARRDLRSVNFFPLDLDDVDLGPDSYNLIVVFRYLNRRLFPIIRAALRPGGRVIYQTFNTRYLNQKPDTNPDYLLRPGELTGYFGDWRILRSSEPEHISQIVAIKPAST